MLEPLRCPKCEARVWYVSVTVVGDQFICADCRFTFVRPHPKGPVYDKGQAQWVKGPWYTDDWEKIFEAAMPKDEARRAQIIKWMVFGIPLPPADAPREPGIDDVTRRLEAAKDGQSVDSFLDSLAEPPEEE